MSKAIYLPAALIRIPEKEIRMTFQVVLIGSDGVVCGSDRMIADRRSVIHPYLKDESDTVELIKRTTGRKILLLRDIACAFAGGPNAEIIARRIITDCDQDGLSLIEWQNQIVACAKSVGGSGGRILDEVIVIRKNNLGVAVRLLIQGNDTPIPFIVERGICTGDVVQAARFLSEQLCDEDSPPMPVYFLERLALLSIAFASKENPTGIGRGCDILTVTPEQGFAIRQYDKNEVDKLCNEFTEQLRQMVRGIDMPRLVESFQ
jgi:hypothetical protein